MAICTILSTLKIENFTYNHPYFLIIRKNTYHTFLKLAYINFTISVNHLDAYLKASLWLLMSLKILLQNYGNFVKNNTILRKLSGSIFIKLTQMLQCFYIVVSI